MAEETKVRVRLDTRQAKSELKGFVRESAATAGRVSGNVRGAIGRGLGVVGFGAAFGTGLSAVRGATQSGLGDVVGEAFGGIGAQLADFVFGDLNEKAIGAKRAREETIAAFGATVGETGKIPPGAKSFFDSIESLRTNEARGREIFEKDDRFRGPGVGEFIDKITTAIGDALSRAVQELLDGLLPWR